MIEERRPPAGMERHREREGNKKKPCSVLRRPISQDQLTVFVMLGFSPCCFSKVACTDFYSNLHLTDTSALQWRPKMASDPLRTSFGDTEMDTGASGRLGVTKFLYGVN